MRMVLVIGFYFLLEFVDRGPLTSSVVIFLIFLRDRIDCKYRIQKTSVFCLLLENETEYETGNIKAQFESILFSS